MSLIQGDEGGILVQFVYARLRSNSGSWPVAPMPFAPTQACPAYGFSVAAAGPSTKEQGGDVLYSTFQLTVLAIGKGNDDDLQTLRVMAKEAAAALRCASGQQGTAIGDGMVLSCTIGEPVTFTDRDEKGVLHWHHGHTWIVQVQPDATAR